MNLFIAAAFWISVAVAFLFLSEVPRQNRGVAFAHAAAESFPQAKSVFYFTDHLGSTRVVTNESAEEQARYSYYPYGEILAPHPNPLPFGERAKGEGALFYLFTGQQHDVETNLYYYGARYYDPNLSVFVSVDPANEETENPYLYVSGNPVGYIDPDGRYEIGVKEKQVPGSSMTFLQHTIASAQKLVGTLKGGEGYQMSIRDFAFLNSLDLGETSGNYLSFQPQGSVEVGNGYTVILYTVTTEGMTQNIEEIDGVRKAVVKNGKVLSGAGKKIGSMSGFSLEFPVKATVASGGYLVDAQGKIVGGRIVYNREAQILTKKPPTETASDKAVILFEEQQGMGPAVVTLFDVHKGGGLAWIGRINIKGAELNFTTTEVNTGKDVSEDYQQRDQFLKQKGFTEQMLMGKP